MPSHNKPSYYDVVIPLPWWRRLLSLGLARPKRIIHIEYVKDDNEAATTSAVSTPYWLRPRK